MIGTRTETHHGTDADLDYGWDLTDWLADDDLDGTPDDVISAVTAELEPATAGTVHDASAVDSNRQAVAWVTGLTEDAVLVFHITTLGGRVDRAHVELLFEDRTA